MDAELNLHRAEQAETAARLTESQNESKVLRDSQNALVRDKQQQQQRNRVEQHHSVDAGQRQHSVHAMHMSALNTTFAADADRRFQATYTKTTPAADHKPTAVPTTPARVLGVNTASVAVASPAARQQSQALGQVLLDSLAADGLFD
jgi:hypothetical protein